MRYEDMNPAQRLGFRENLEAERVSRVAEMWKEQNIRAQAQYLNRKAHEALRVRTNACLRNVVLNAVSIKELS